MPGIEDEADVAGADLRDQFAGFGESVDEGVASAHEEQLRADIFEPEPDAVLLQHLADLAQTRGVLFEIRPIGQDVVARTEPRADPAGARFLQGGGESGKFGHSVLEGGVVLAEIDRQSRGRPDEPFGLEVGKGVGELLGRHACEFLGPGFDRLKPMPVGEVVGFALALNGYADTAGSEGNRHFASRRAGREAGGQGGEREGGRGGLQEITTVHGVGMGPQRASRAGQIKGDRGPRGR